MLIELTQDHNRMSSLHLNSILFFGCLWISQEITSSDWMWVRLNKVQVTSHGFVSATEHRWKVWRIIELLITTTFKAVNSYKLSIQIASIHTSNQSSAPASTVWLNFHRFRPAFSDFEDFHSCKAAMNPNNPNNWVQFQHGGTQYGWVGASNRCDQHFRSI